MKFKAQFAAIVTATIFSGAVHADINSNLQQFVDTTLQEILNSGVVVSSIKEQNLAHENLSQADIDALDIKWRSEADGGSGDLIDKVLSNELSAYLLQSLDDSEGIFTEIFVMDNRGLNVGQSGLTSDYWQGDEDKWQQTYSTGPNSVHASEIEFDESSQTYQLQISIPVVDSETNSVIGAATFGVNAEALDMISLGDDF
jgi:hypothetical protein